MKHVLLVLIRGYQLTFSAVMGRQCRFTPTCSAYAHEAISRYGSVTGSKLTWQRLCKCHPFSGQHGFDPVPDLPTAPGAGLAKTGKTDITPPQA